MEMVLIVLLVQAVFGAADNLIHHELQARLPARASARRELALHAAREAIYAVIFLALAWSEPGGLWAVALGLLLAAEVAITMADFIEEDRSRALPPAERALHAGLAVGYGVFLALLAPHLWNWTLRPTALVAADHGVLSWILTAFAVGVAIWAARNARAVGRLGVIRLREYGPPASDAKTVLVTGATGFIGGHLVSALRAAGRRVIVWTRDPVQAMARFDPHVIVVRRLDDLPAETRIDDVVNLAGAPVIGWPWTPARRRALIASRVETTKAVITLIARLARKPAAMVSASAVGFYGVRDDEPLDERARPGRGFQSLLCRLPERAARRVTRHGVRSVELRIGFVLGPGGAFAPMALAARFGLGAILGSGRQVMSWVHVDDVVRLIVFALDRGLSGPLNATAPQAVAQAAFARALARACRRPLLLRVPAFALHLAMGEQAEILTGGQNVRPVKAQAAGFWFRYPTIDMALDNLVGGAQPVPFVERLV